MGISAWWFDSQRGLIFCLFQVPLGPDIPYPVLSCCSTYCRPGIYLYIDRSPRWTSGSPRMLLVLVREFESRRGEREREQKGGDNKRDGKKTQKTFFSQGPDIFFSERHACMARRQRREWFSSLGWVSREGSIHRIPCTNCWVVNGYW